MLASSYLLTVGISVCVRKKSHKLCMITGKKISSEDYKAAATAVMCTHSRLMYR